MKPASRKASLLNLSLVLSLLFTTAVWLTTVPASAQSNAWRVDQEHSIARLSLGGGAQSVEAGIAHVNGRASFHPADPASARFDLTIQRDDAQAPQYSEITFKSKRSWTDRGRLLVRGDFTVTRVVRPVHMDANEGYHGAQYGAPVAYTNTREVTLAFPEVRSATSLDRAIRLSASATVHAEDFPLLQAALQSGDWPNVMVEDRQSAPVSAVGEDYAGFPSSGSPVVTATNSVPVGSGEAFYGFQPAAAPDVLKATIELDLKLARPIALGSDVTPSLGN